MRCYRSYLKSGACHYEKDCLNKGKQFTLKEAPLKSNPLSSIIANESSSAQANIEQSLLSSLIAIRDLESLLQLLQKSSNTYISNLSISSSDTTRPDVYVESEVNNAI